MKRLKHIFVAICVFGIFSITMVGARADTFRLDYGNTSSTDQVVNIIRVPIVDNAGNVIYKDIQLKLKLGANGKFSVAPGFPKTTNSPALVGVAITAGKYRVNDTDNFVEIIGPSIGPNNREQWVLAGVENSASMTFYSGPVTGHPLQDRLNAAGINSSPYLFGTSSNAGNAVMFSLEYFGLGALVSITSAGQNIQINSHSYYGKEDRKIPYESRLLRKCTNPACKP